jgi:predicted dehydrogenase
MSPHRIAVIGLGAISLRAHLPVIAAHPGFEIVASAEPRPVVVPAGGRLYHDHRAMLAAEPTIEAVAICTPPDVRGAIALDAIAAGKHVMLEKPPASTLGELRRIRAAAEQAGVTVFAGWHSRFGLGVERAREVLAGEQVASVEMIWRENAPTLHPDQAWMWRRGGFGVLEFGINGFSILTRILPDPLVVRAATLHVPLGSETPIAAEIAFAGEREGDRLHAEMDWRAPAVTRTIEVLTRSGRRVWLGRTGQHLEVDGALLVDEPNLEYERMYDRFAALIESGESELDDSPLVVVADAVLVGRTVAAP